MSLESMLVEMERKQSEEYFKTHPLEKALLEFEMCVTKGYAKKRKKTRKWWEMGGDCAVN